MKLIYMIALFYILNPVASLAVGSAYYVSNSGSDSNNGDITHPFLTIAKANSVAVNGDFIYLKKGDTFSEKVIINASVSLGAYGTGNKPIVTGFQTPSLTDSSGVYYATLSSSPSSLNTVLYNGNLVAKARTPNSGYNTVSSYSGNTTTVNTSLTGTPSYVGAELVNRSTHWILDVANITAQSTGVLTVSNTVTGTSLRYLTYAPSATYGGNGYFIQNILNAIDQNGEWCFNGTTKKFYIRYSGTPTIQVSTLDTLVYINNKSSVTIDGISFTGANRCAFEIDSSSNIIVQNCTIRDCGEVGAYISQSRRVSFLNDSLQNILNGGLYFGDWYNPKTRPSDTCLVQSCDFKRIAVYPGMGVTDNNTYTGIYSVGVASKFQYNRLDSIGYNGIVYAGNYDTVQYNYITNTDFVKDDGGGIYSVVGTYYTGLYSNSHSLIKNNIVLHGIGASAGTSFDSYAAGVYIDDTSKNITISGNTFIDGFGRAANFSNADSLTVINNTGVDSLGNVFQFAGFTGTGIFPNSYGNVFTGNVAYSQSASQLAFYTQFTSTGTYDYNYYLRPAGESTLLKNISTTYSLSGWQSATGRDAHSSGTPSGITAALPLIYYNPTQADSTIALSGLYIDARGAEYNNSITLNPYTSAILFKADHEVIKSKMYTRSFKISMQ